jgi:hypothetical protein
VPAAVHHDFLPFERRVQIRDHSYLPITLLGKDECLRRRQVLVPGAERARRQLVGAWRIE